MGNRIYHISALIFLLFISCQKVQEDCTEKGDFTRIERSVSDFHAVSVADRLDVILVTDASKKGIIALEGYGNLFSGVRVEVKEGTLFLSDHNRCKWLRSLKDRIAITVYIDDKLDFLYTLDDASIQTQDTLRFDFLQFDHRSTHNQFLQLDGTRFWIEHYEAGEVLARGRAGVIKVTNFETGVFDGRGLQCEDVFIHHYGLNKIHAMAERTLECQIENSGDILYYKIPSNSPQLSGQGTGQLLRAF